jgi:hypothetical protein
MTLRKFLPKSPTDMANLTRLQTAPGGMLGATTTDIDSQEPGGYNVPHPGSLNGDTNATNGAVPPVLSTDTLVSIDQWLPLVPAPTLGGRRRRLTRERFDVLAQWEGVVLSTGDDSFVARLSDLSGKHPEEEAEFDIQDVSDADHALLGAGASFYWILGYHTRPNGQRVRESVLRFRRLPMWTSQEIEAARKWAADVVGTLGAG